MCTKERVETDGTGQETSMEDVADRVLPEQQGTLPASSAAGGGGAGNSLHPPPPPHGPDPDSEIRDDELEEPSEVSHNSNQLCVRCIGVYIKQLFLDIRSKTQGEKKLKLKLKKTQN